MENNTNNRLDELIVLIREKSGEHEMPITRDTLLEDDLGVTGDDAYELLVALSEKFHFSMTDFHFSTYFNDEPSPFTSGRKVSPFTVGHIEKAIVAGRLDEGIISSERKEKSGTHVCTQGPLERQQVTDNIERNGCHIAFIEPDNYLPGFAYSIGLYQRFNHPEIICFGLSSEVMGGLINDACGLIGQGRSLQTDNRYPDFLKEYDVQFLSVSKEFYPHYLGYGGWYYDAFDFPAFQLVWPDKEHHFPWQPSFNQQLQFKQPLLDRSTDFLFYEPRNVCVFTTRQVLEGAPILFVYHNADGDWQFHTSDDPTIDDAKVVALGQITKLDPTINEIYHLQYGWHAWRNSREEKWEYAEDVLEGEEDNASLPTEEVLPPATKPWWRFW